MKKILLLMIILLMGCHEDEPVKKNIDQVAEEDIEIVEEIEYIEENDLKSFIYEVNDQLRVIDLDLLHRRIEAILLEKIDFSLSIDEQTEIIEDVILDELDIWRREVVKEVIETSGDVINEDDYETIVSRTSIRAAFEVMVSYERVYLKNRGKSE